MSDSKHIVCPQCGAINRVPATRSAAAAQCGSCKSKLFAGEPREVDAAGFDRHVGKGDVPVLVDVWAPWCGPCLSMAPQFANAAHALEPDVRLLKLNSEQHREIAARYDIRSIPTMLLFKDGKLAARTAGAMDSASIARWVKSNL